MEYSALNDIPYVGLVDAGTVELVRSFGVDVVSSGRPRAVVRGPLVARQPSAAHLEAGKAVHAAIRAGFGSIREAVCAGSAIGEYEVQRVIVEAMSAQGVEADEPPIVAVNANCSNPHYSPTPESSQPIRRGDFVLLDVFGKQRVPGAVYFDITWTGFVGEQVPERHAKIFSAS